MSAVLKPDYNMRPMLDVDLDAIMQIEPLIYSHPWTRGNFNDSLKAGHKAWVMTSDDEIVGYAVIMIVLDEAHLLNMSIALPYQKQGLGRMLLLHLIDQAKTFRTENMFLEVRASNVSAIALYENVGFVEMSIRRGYYPANKGREDAILMGLALSGF
jgi:[ribosomal protein S18]-alanine N-acetyltransferase